MNLRGEPFYRIQKNCFEGFICAMLQNYKLKDTKMLVHHYQHVQKMIDIQYPTRQRRKRDEMKPQVWKWFFDGVLGKKNPLKVEVCISKRRTIFWRTKKEDKDCTSQQTIRILGLTCREVIREMGEEKLEMFDQIFEELEKQQ
jgi:hypothetical protein